MFTCWYNTSNKPIVSPVAPGSSLRLTGRVSPLARAEKYLKFIHFRSWGQRNYVSQRHKVSIFAVLWEDTLIRTPRSKFRNFLNYIMKTAIKKSSLIDTTFHRPTILWLLSTVGNPVPIMYCICRICISCKPMYLEVHATHVIQFIT